MKIKKIYLIGLILAVFIISIGISIYLLLINNQKKGPLANPISPQNSFQAIKKSTPTPPNPSPASPENVFNILLLGQGDPSHSGSNLTDTMEIIHLDPTQKYLALISVPRDTWVPIVNADKTEKQKINAAYSSGGFPLVKKTVKSVTGLPIQFAILVDFNGFTQAIDILGGIEVNVPVTFDDYFYPVKGKEQESCNKSPEEITALSTTMSGFQLEKQFTCRYEHLHFDAGMNHLDGNTALKFVRSRHSDQHGGDFARAQRQQALLLGIKDKLLSLNALDNILPFFDKLIGSVKTDLDRPKVKSIADLIVNAKEYKISHIVLSDQNIFVSSKGPKGEYILVPKSDPEKWEEVQQFVKNQIESGQNP